MIRIRSALAIASAIFFLGDCASKPQTPPDWAENLERVYPRETYLTGRGAGKSRAEAEASALEAIARIFSVEVERSAEGRESFITKDGITQETRELTAETFVRSAVELFGVRYDNNPWQNPQTHEWETVAYIHREEAWAIFEPRLQSAAEAFTAALDAAEREEDPIRRYSRYRAAGQSGSAEQVRSALAFAQVLHPEKARGYSAAQNALADENRREASAKSGAVISVSCANDVDGIIAGAIAAAFQAGGFTAGSDAARDANRASAVIAEGRQDAEGGASYTPSLIFNLYDAAGEAVLFTWGPVYGPRRAAANPATAKRNAWNALADEIKTSLLREFDTAMKGGIK
jgi:hypothetical protein